MTDSSNKPGLDWILLVAIAAQTLIGILAISSAVESYAERYLDYRHYFLIRHSAFLLVSMAVFAGLFRYWPIAFVRRHIRWALAIPFVMLLMTLLPGFAITINGANRWLSIGPLNVYVMPIAIVVFLFYLSDFLARHRGERELFTVTSLKLAIIGIGVCLITSSQPDTAGGAILLTLLLLMSLLAGLRRFAGVGTIVLGLGFLLFAINQPYRISRLAAFLNPFEDRFNTGYQFAMGLTALGGGDLWGVGYGRGIVKTLLPGVKDHYLFAAVVEEVGAVGALAILALSAVIFFRSMRICHRLFDNRKIFEGMLVFGLTIWTCLMTVCHVAGVTGLIPPTGFPYPLLSYGNSYLLSFMVSFAVILRLGLEPGEQKPAGAMHVIKSLRKPTLLLPMLLFGIVGYAVADRSLGDDFLDREYRARTNRHNNLAAAGNTDGDEKRGRILDRFGHVLARNVPQFEVWADPRSFDFGSRKLGTLAALLELNKDALVRRIERGKKQGRAFLYLRRNVGVDAGERLSLLGIRGVSLAASEGRRYPSGEAAAQLVGIADIDGIGQEGVESRFNEQLLGPERSGDVWLSIDKRIQERTFAALREVSVENEFRNGSAIVVRTKTGEVLAMASFPEFDPNDRNRLSPHNLRNNAINYQLEPGAAASPFAVLSFMSTANDDVDTSVDTAPGYHAVGGHRISDPQNHGVLGLDQILQKHSKVGLAKLALDTPREFLWGILRSVGYGSPTGIELLNEPTGYLNHYDNWSEIEHATTAYGYGLLVTPIQIARAYTILANDGVERGLTLLKDDGTREVRRVLEDPAAVRKVRYLLERTVDRAEERRINGNRGDSIRIASQRSLVQKTGPSGYVDRYRGVFVAIAPIDEPEIAVVVVVDDAEKDPTNAARTAEAAGSKMVLESLAVLDQY